MSTDWVQLALLLSSSSKHTHIHSLFELTQKKLMALSL